ncbi:MAG: glycosyltransferase [Candidatus Lokiarchaeota archaeon]|nr:glycosyltransferase [Candidatus Lokiarchaeota archaeon]
MEKNQPFITIFTPNYNKSKFISETIESIINQTYTNFEYIIIDDCSTDDSWNIIQNYAKIDSRIKCYRNEKNLKIVETRNKGFQYSSPNAKYFSIIDSDDVAYSKRLERQIDFLENNQEYGMIGSNAIIINEDSKIIGNRNYPLENDKIKKLIPRVNPFTQSSVTLRKKTIKEIGFYDKRWFVCQDYDYWLRVGRKWKLKNLNKPLIKYRLNTNQVKNRFLKETLKHTFEIQKKAIIKYGYKDSIYLKLNRLFLKILILFPRLTLVMYKIYIKYFSRILKL